MPHPTAPRRALALAALALVVGACSGDGGPKAVARVTLSGVAGPADSLTVGDQRTLVVALADAKGGAIVGRAVVWTSSDHAVATVDAAGMVSAVAPGQATITAESEGVRGQLGIAVRRRPVASVLPERATDTLWLGRPRALRAEPRAADGSALRDRIVSWSSADSARVVLSTAADGSVVARGVMLGATQLTVRSEGATATVPVVVVPVPVARITLAAPESLAVGSVTTVRATATAPDGTLVGASELAGRSVVWMSDRVGVVAVAGLADSSGQSASGFNATARAVGPGGATITAAIDGGLGRVTMVATRRPVARLQFASSSVSLLPGRSTTVVAAAFDADGASVLGAPIVYTLVDGADVARVTQTAAADGTPTARIDAIAPGIATVGVSADGATARMTVRVVGSGATLRAYPSSITAAPGAQGKLAAWLTDGAGTPVTTGAVEYRSTNAGVVTVDATGRVTMVAPGAASITVNAAGFTTSVPVTVAPAPTSTFRIDVRPVGQVPAAIVDAARLAAQRWERVITTALPAQRVDFNAGQCEPGTPAVHEQVGGVIVFLTADSIDGPRKTLAYAGPCAVRDPAFGGLPIVGSMTVDLGDVATLTGTSGALALDVLTHEIGHVLGIGTLWRGGSPAGNLTRNLTTDPRFVGAGAAAAAERLGLSATVDEGAAIEDEGGLGTALGHWRERVFLGELMTGWINPSPNPLSIVTVLSLRDLGYQVTETGADLVSPTTIAGGPAFVAGIRSGASLSRSGSSPAPLFLGERLRTPRYVVRRGGRVEPIGGAARR